MKVLGINPWIYDFAAYDFWLKPYGFLVILTYLKNKGVEIDYVDCLDKKITQDHFGRGKYYSQIIPKPDILKNIPRHFKRYGITWQELESFLKNKRNNFILITSSMTYWYPAIKDLLKIIKKYFVSSPSILGGNYVNLCYSHAKGLGADFVFENKELKNLFNLIGLEWEEQELYSTLPAYEYFYSHLDYVVLRTSWGCPFNCSYCAIKKLAGAFWRILEHKVINFILKYHRRGIKDFVLYDDAFLYGKEYPKKLLKTLYRLNLDIRFHTPNALHLRFLDEEIAFLLKRCGFINPHFGLETLDSQLQKSWGDKVNREDLIKGINYLKKGGFKDGEFSVYLLLGYPQQNLKTLKEEIDFLHSLGARVSLSEFSPTPQTEIFKTYQRKLSEPLLHNNSIFVFFSQDKIKEFWKIKNYARQLNRKFSS